MIPLHSTENHMILSKHTPTSPPPLPSGINNDQSLNQSYLNQINDLRFRYDAYANILYIPSGLER